MTNLSGETQGTFGARRNVSTRPDPYIIESPGNSAFYVQRHDASSMHFELLLEINGELKRWVVPRGPATEAGASRLAIRTDDLPSVAPDTGAGSTVTWDKGRYLNLRSIGPDFDHRMNDCLAKGVMEIWLDGDKLIGGYALQQVRAGDTPHHWLLVRMRDEEAIARIKANEYRSSEPPGPEIKRGRRPRASDPWS